METKVREMLNRKGWDLYSIEPEATVYDAIFKMDELDIGALVVLDGSDLAGILTERDYMKRIALEGRSSQTTSVQTIMTRDVVCVDPDYTVRESMAIMTDVRCRHLPVIKNGLASGLVSIGDCVQHLTRDLRIEIRHLKDFITSRYPC